MCHLPAQTTSLPKPKSECFVFSSLFCSAALILGKVTFFQSLWFDLYISPVIDQMF